MYSLVSRQVQCTLCGERADEGRDVLGPSQVLGPHDDRDRQNAAVQLETTH